MMFVKNISFMCLLCLVNCILCSPLATKLMLTRHTTNKSEEYFTKTYEQCLQDDNDDANKEHNQADHCIVYAMIQLIQHINNLKHDHYNEPDKCEKCEAEIIKKELIALLKKNNN